MFALARVHKGTRDVLEVRRTFPCEREDTLGNSLFSFSYTGNNKQHPLLLLLLLFLRSIRAAWLFFSSFLFVQTSPHRFDKNFICCLFFECFSFPSWLCVFLVQAKRFLLFLFLTPFDSRDWVANPMLPFSPCSPRSLKSHEYILRLHAIRRKRFSFPSILGWFIGIARSEWNSENSFVITRQPNVDWMICDGAKRRNVFRLHPKQIRIPSRQIRSNSLFFWNLIYRISVDCRMHLKCLCLDGEELLTHALARFLRLWPQAEEKEEGTESPSSR
jgi:hypothetical protein